MGTTDSSLFDDLVARGMVHDTTGAEAIAARLAAGPSAIYIGFDPTADSLHAGNLVGQLLLRRFQLAGHRPFALAGGATGMIGDPGGRSSERNLLSPEELRHNVECVKVQLTRLLDFDAGPTQATLVNNADWTSGVTMLEFLRDVGKHFTVNQMVARDSVRTRLESEHGISYTEFSYMLLQANDFRHLYEEHGVEFQAGATDQWGNIVSGVDLVRRRLGATVHGLVHPLITKSDGSKFGKSVDGAVWLDPEKTSPYKFWQFWRQADDDMVSTYLKMMSLRPLGEVLAIVAEHDAAPHLGIGQRALADEMTALVHGVEAASGAAEAADLLFRGDPLTAGPAAFATLMGEIPAGTLPSSALDDPVQLLVESGLASSNGDARRTLQQNGAKANGQPLVAGEPVGRDRLAHGRYLLLRKGKKLHYLVDVAG